MKKKTKALIAGLAVLPLALVAGCGGGGENPAKVGSFDDNAFNFESRTYSSETEISNENSFGTDMTKPTTANGEVVGTQTNSDGSKVITMANVEEEEYNNYKSQVEKTTVATGEGTYSVEYDAETKTMTITYTLPEGTSSPTGPSSFRTVNLIDSSKQSLYIKYKTDLATMYPTMTREEAYAKWESENPGTEDTDNTLKEAYYQQILANRPKGQLAAEIATRKNSKGGVDTSVAMYLNKTNFLELAGSGMNESLNLPSGTLLSMNYKSATIDGTTYSLTYMDAIPVLNMPATGVYMKSTGDDGVGLPIEVDNSDFGIIGNSYDELLGMYASTGYEKVGDNVYYFEEFKITETDETNPEITSTSFVKFYFNGNDLIYADVDGMFVEIYVSNTIPSYMFETRVPDGYMDMSIKPEL